MAFITPDPVDPGDVLSASKYNADVVDNMTAIGGVWTTFTPQLRTGSTNRTSTNAYGKYLAAGKLVMVQAKVTSTAVGGASEPIKLSLPSGFSTFKNAPGDTGTIGTFFFQDTGTALYTGVACILEAGFVSGVANNTVAQIGQSPAFTMASGDVISYSVWYEIA